MKKSCYTHRPQPRQKPVCPCGNDKTDALWVLDIKGDKPIRVHQPCGQTLLRSAPEGVTGELRPSRELKEIHKKRKFERQLTKNFWESKLSDARAKSFQTDLVQTAPERMDS